MKNQDDYSQRRIELEEYLARIKHRLVEELKKYGWTWEQLVAAYKLPKVEKQLLDEEWKGYYADRSQRPTKPNPCEFGEYLEYLRVEQLLMSPQMKVAMEIFS